MNELTIHRAAAAASAVPFSGVIEEVALPPDIEIIFRALAGRRHCIFFDSARFDSVLGRYSYLAAEPFEWLEISTAELEKTNANTVRAPLARVGRRLQACATESLPGIPPFQGGAAGLLSYDLHHALERVAYPRFDEFKAPVLAMGLYDVVLAIDHVEQQAWIVSQGWPEREPAARRRRAAARLEQFKGWLAEASAQGSGFRVRGSVALGGSRGFVLPQDQLAPQFPTLAGTSLTSNFSHAAYLHAIERAIEYIRAGDIFQVNLAQRLLHPARDDSVSLYLRLRRRNPATFAAYFDLGDLQIVSASPERFLQAQNRQVEARPIKGTRRRSPWPEADLFAGDELLQSEKDRAENVMIVDLLRNDLSRVCTPDSVRVSDLCRLETYEFVQHLVSVVQGELRADCGPLDLVEAAFPGGSITGAPKVRAMQIIAELEPTARGPYCGCLAYVGFDGSMDASILIRTITAGRGWWQLPVGGGIVAQSEPEREYEETWHKAEGMLRALE
jgi:para-aminobenzoate synthetase component 1